MHSLETNQQIFIVEKSFARYFTAIFGPLIGVIYALDTMVIHVSTFGHLTLVVHTPDLSAADIAILYSLSTCLVFSISLLFGYYGAWRELRKNLQDNNSNHLNKRKKCFNFYSSYNRHMSILYGPLLVFAVTADSLMVLLYSSNLSTADIV
ncbi:MAG: hypothetical protein ACPHUG_04285, partial [Porticoccaceae bacterium]